MPIMLGSAGDRFARLNTAELLVTVSFRLWFASCRDIDAAGAIWHKGFDMAGLDRDAVVSFDLLVRMIVASKKQGVDAR